MAVDKSIYPGIFLYYEPTQPGNRSRPIPSYYDNDNALTEPIAQFGSNIPPPQPPRSFNGDGGNGHNDPPHNRNLFIAIAGIIAAVIFAIIVTALIRSHISSPQIPSNVATATTVVLALTQTVPSPSIATATIASHPIATIISTCTGFTTSPATNSTTFANVKFPTGTMAQSTQDSELDGFQYRDIAVCTQGINTTAGIASAYANINAPTGWTKSDPATEVSSGSGCTTDLCLKFIDKTTLGVPVNEYVTILHLQAIGTTSTYQVRLTIAPLFAGTATLNKGNSFSFEGAGLADYDWSMGSAIMKGSNTAISALPNTTTYAAATYRYISNLAINTLATISQTVDSAIVLKDNRGHYGKSIIQASTATSITFAYIIYGFGF